MPVPITEAAPSVTSPASLILARRGNPNPPAPALTARASQIDADFLYPQDQTRKVQVLQERKPREDSPVLMAREDVGVAASLEKMQGREMTVVLSGYSNI